MKISNYVLPLTLGLILTACTNDSTTTALKTTTSTQVEDSTNPVSKFFGSVASSVASDVASDAVGWAVSALGISGTSTEDADLDAIEDLLEDIDSELATLVTEVEALECLTDQDQSTLTESIKNIQGLYDTYSNWVKNAPTIPCYETSDTEGNICYGQSDIKTWLTEVVNPDDGVDAALDAINDTMIQAGDVGVIYTCVKVITDTYTSGSGPTDNPFDDRPYYDDVQELTNYYYGIQAMGAALLVEAYHIQACLELGTSNCLFTGQTASDPLPASLGYSPDSPGDICQDATSQAAADCTDAQTALLKVYNNVLPQLTQAGAPYSTHYLGLLWGKSLVFTKDLGDLTNSATVNGATQSTCSTPLTSKSPCGFTVGEYNLTFDSALTYGGYPYTYDDENGAPQTDTNIWQPATGKQLNDLLATYQAKTTGDTTASLGTWMNSVGFANTDNITATTATTGTAWGTKTICFMDTAISRSSSKQPWCDGVAEGTSALTKVTSSGSCTGACYYSNLEQASYTDSPVDSGFYTMKMTERNDYGYSYSWSTKPGWLEEEQGSTANQQFHWPVMDITSLTCSESTTNPGGQYTLCGTDLTDWLAIQLPKPDVSSSVLAAAKSKSKNEMKSAKLKQQKKIKKAQLSQTNN